MEPGSLATFWSSDAIHCRPGLGTGWGACPGRRWGQQAPVAEKPSNPTAPLHSVSPKFKHQTSTSPSTSNTGSICTRPTPAMAKDSTPSIHSLDRPEKLQDLLKEDRGDDCLSCKIVGESIPFVPFSSEPLLTTHAPLQAVARSSASPPTATSRASRSSSCSGPRSWPAARGSACAAGAWPSRASRSAWPGWASGGWSNEGTRLGIAAPFHAGTQTTGLGWAAGRPTDPVSR